jgi:ribokinase
MTDVVVAGAINTDLVARVERAPESGETVTGSTFDVFGGGKGANQTLASSRSGAGTAILGAVGADDFGRQRLADLISDGVDVSAVLTRSDAPSGVALITVENATGQNRIAYVPGATLTITPEEARAAIVRLAPKVFLTTLELPAESIEAAIAAARECGAVVIMNATPEPEGAARFLTSIDTLIVNEPEAIALGGAEDGDWFALADRLREMGPANIVITLGEKGAVASFQGDRISASVPSVSVVDTTGAGDAVCGSFAAAIATGDAPADALRYGVAAGSLACTINGAQLSQPGRAKILEILGQTE